MKRATRIGVCLVAALALGASGEPSSPADLIVTGGRVYTADGTGRFEEALAIRGDRIVAVGSAAEIGRLRGDRTEVIDAGGRAVLPGFNDVHAHLSSGGLAMDDVNLEGASTLSEVQQRIRTFAGEHPDRPWIRGRGWQYAPFPGNRPTRQQLDEVTGNRPAILRCFDGHSVWVNSKALELAGIGKDTPNPPNGEIVREEKTGQPTGLLKESAMALANRVVPPPSRDELRRALRNALNEALRYGVTSITDAAGTVEELDLLGEMAARGELPARVYYSLLVTPGFQAADADRLDEAWKRHPDGPFLKTGIIKLFLDGVIETNTAFMLAPYANAATTGAPNYTREEYERIVGMLDARGWQIMVHALGDGAVRMALDTFERIGARPAPERGRRHRLEHIETIDSADVPRFGKLRVIASMHPGGGFLPQNRPPVETGPALTGAWAVNLGPERVARSYAWKSIADAGGTVVFGSDWPVASLNAMNRITSIANRAPRQGGADQRLPLTTAIDDYTRVPAYASFDERQKGTLAPGMLADVVVLATDVFGRPAAAPADVAVWTTIVGGKVAVSPGIPRAQTKGPGGRPS